MTATNEKTQQTGVVNFYNGTAIFSFKQLRMKIAKWALRSSTINADDLKSIIGYDIQQIVNTAVTELLKSFTNQTLSNAIQANASLSESQKAKIGAILAESSDISHFYIG